MLNLASTKKKYPDAFKGKPTGPMDAKGAGGLADASDDDAYAEGDESSPKAALSSALSALESATTAVKTALKNCK